ncbi:hypothetical protein CVT25_013562 [Psilocybe cyanescens]|uniref:Aminotransferase class V domain-containing protein n=1 Tax=Psilocybe cyanescens TaxID=93625 RepID=A0A409XSR7_PSICY|nr:hypothetical protein CVT25_013562 [Psilocybe cyanescens]
MRNSKTHLNGSASSKGHGLSHKRSGFLSRISLGCASVNSFDSDEFSPEVSKLVNEKMISVDHLYQPRTFVSSVAYAPVTAYLDSNEEEKAFEAFLQEYPEYQLTWILDTLRRTDFARLERAGETYVDYMGGSLYPESLIRAHTDFLNGSILGNTHSVSNTSKLSLKCADDARQAVLSHFKASSDYTVVFTANASGALKLVAEAYPFTQGSSLVLGADAHNSVHGIREFAKFKNAEVAYIPSTSRGGFDVPTAKNTLLQNRPRSKDASPSLFIQTSQSNITNSKTPLSMTEYAASLGYHVVVDGAALAPTSIVNISEYPIDAMAVSFYKMFGYPTGVGALIVKKSFLAQLRRPWFAGGTVDVVQVPGNIMTRAHEMHEQFEDGTINYLQLSAITNGLRFLSAYLPFLPLRLSSLIFHLTSTLSKIRHDSSGRPVVQILSRAPTKRLRSVGDQSDAGSILALLFFNPSGEMLPNSFIEYAASTQNISLRTGCMCNPGGAAAILDIVEEMGRLYPGVTLQDFEDKMGRELGVVRISLGIATNFHDAWRVTQFVASIGNEFMRQKLWKQWEATRSEIGHGHAS